MSLDGDSPHGRPDEGGTVLELHFSSEAAANVHLLSAIFGEAARPERTERPKAAAASCGAPRAAGALGAPPGGADARGRSRSRTGSLGR